jgi:DNA-binding NarL/FixJ family response regulator
MAIRILICDDHRLMQRGVATLLQGETGMRIVGVASNTEEAIRLAHEQRPDLVLMDISMPGGGGIEATRQLSKSLPTVRVLIFTVHEDEKILREVLDAGAVGYVVKRAAESELLDAIRAVMRGEVYVHPAMTRSLLRTLKEQPPAEEMAANSLTAREVDVLRLLARGYTNRQIGEKLSLSVRTVEGHRANITGKLGLRSRVDLAGYAERHDLLD